MHAHEIHAHEIHAHDLVHVIILIVNVVFMWYHLTFALSSAQYLLRASSQHHAKLDRSMKCSSYPIHYPLQAVGRALSGARTSKLGFQRHFRLIS